MRLRTAALGFAALMIFALPADARRWGGGNRMQQGESRVYEWTTTTTSSDALTANCGLIQYVYDDDVLGTGTAAAATLRTCADPSTPAAQCTDITLTSDTNGVIDATTPVVSVVSITSTGATTAKARVTLRCQDTFAQIEEAGFEFTGTPLASEAELEMSKAGFLVDGACTATNADTTPEMTMAFNYCPRTASTCGQTGGWVLIDSNSEEKLVIRDRSFTAGQMLSLQPASALHGAATISCTAKVTQ